MKAKIKLTIWFIILFITLIALDVTAEFYPKIASSNISVFWISDHQEYESLKKQDYTQKGSSFIKKERNKCKIHALKIKDRYDEKGMANLGYALKECFGDTINIQPQKNPIFHKRTIKNKISEINDFPVVSIEFKYTSRLNKELKRLSKLNYLRYKRKGMSGWSDAGKCHIYYLENDYSVAGHELLHCLFGSFHKELPDANFGKMNKEKVKAIREQYKVN